MMLFSVVLIIFSTYSSSAEHNLISLKRCNARQAEYGPICVCNSTYCDTAEEILPPTDTLLQYFATSKDDLGYKRWVGSIPDINDYKDDISNFRIEIDTATTFQKIIGFGSAFTDSAGQNVLDLPEAAQQLFKEANFAEDGNAYTLCRVPIGGSDFSPEVYTYADRASKSLDNFALKNEDLTYKIPFILSAKEIRGNNTLKLVASAWVAPKWMLTENFLHVNFLKEEYYQTWADYYVKFFDKYQERGVDFWAVTTQNEPATGFIPFSIIPSIAWFPSQMTKWISSYFGPTIKNSTSTDHLKILAFDDQKIFLPLLKGMVLDDAEASKYIDGVAIHWYSDLYTPPSFLSLVDSPKEDWIILNTEACNGFGYNFGLDEAVKLGSWERADNYIQSIMDDLEYGANGWIDWNMALDETGGPCNVRNNVDSPIIVNKTSGEFYKQPTFYALGHFSKFLIPGTVRVETKITVNVEGVRAMSFLRPDGIVACIIWNKSELDVATRIRYMGRTLTVRTVPFSINTALFKSSKQ